ncbi:hypothetical protein HanIR_Chr15g0784461 [Helianthus annuus]|nr:hypothetical protein HanIR_Chr15g0784461 [Helianthus annuus]
MFFCSVNVVWFGKRNPVKKLAGSATGSPDGKLEWGFRGEDATKLRKCASFGYGGCGHANVNHEQDVSWVNTLVKDVGPKWIEQKCI